MDGRLQHDVQGATGSPRAIQPGPVRLPCMPSTMLCTLVKPYRVRKLRATVERLPRAQISAIGWLRSPSTAGLASWVSC